jgi:hypothetical protein
MQAQLCYRGTPEGERPSKISVGDTVGLLQGAEFKAWDRVGGRGVHKERKL